MIQHHVCSRWYKAAEWFRYLAIIISITECDIQNSKVKVNPHARVNRAMFV